MYSRNGVKAIKKIVPTINEKVVIIKSTKTFKRVSLNETCSSNVFSFKITKRYLFNSLFVILLGAYIHVYVYVICPVIAY